MSDSRSWSADMETTQLDTQTTTESNVAVRPEEPSLPPLEWMQRNLFGGGQEASGPSPEAQR